MEIWVLTGLITCTVVILKLLVVYGYINRILLWEKKGNYLQSLG